MVVDRVLYSLQQAVGIILPRRREKLLRLHIVVERILKICRNAVGKYFDDKTPLSCIGIIRRSECCHFLEDYVISYKIKKFHPISNNPASSIFIQSPINLRQVSAIFGKPHFNLRAGGRFRASEITRKSRQSSSQSAKRPRLIKALS